jgi:hypothetical protein
MHAAEHRALRELYALTGQLARHWAVLGERLGGTEGALLAAGAETATALREALPDVTAARDLHVGAAARNAGRAATPRLPVSDRLLERNQALRNALHDAVHVVVLLSYCAQLAKTRGDEELRLFCGRHERALAKHEKAVRAAAVALGEDPDAAILPAHDSVAGRAGHKVNFAFGSLGEYLDRRGAGS